MPKCPNCGSDESTSVKSWSMIGKPSKSGDMSKLTIAMYKCTACGKNYRCVQDKEKITMKGVLDRNSELEEKFMEATKKRAELETYIQALEEEKACLSAEVEALRIIPTLVEKTSHLESTVINLREEKQALLSRINDIMAEKKVTTEEKPLEVPPAQSTPEVNPVADEVAPTVEEAVAVEPSVETELESPVAEELRKFTQPEPTLSEDKQPEALPPEPTPTLSDLVEAVTEPEQISVSEPQMPEPTVSEISPEIPSIEVKTLELEASSESIDSVDVSFTEKSAESPLIEAAPSDALTPEVTQAEFTPVEPTPAVETPMDASVEVAATTPIEDAKPVPAEPTGEPIVEAVTLLEEHLEAPAIEASTETQTPKVMGVVESVVEAVTSTNQPTQDASYLSQEAEAKAAETAAAYSPQTVETVEAMTKEAAVTPVTATTTLGDPTSALVVNTTPIEEADPEAAASETRVDEASPAEKREDMPETSNPL